MLHAANSIRDIEARCGMCVLDSAPAKQKYHTIDVHYQETPKELHAFHNGLYSKANGPSMQETADLMVYQDHGAT